MITSLFNTILYQPIFNVFVGLYNFIPGHDVGIVILVITVILRLALYPLTGSSFKAQRSLQELQPKLEAIKKQYAGDQQKQAQATMALYKESKVNPFASCLPLLIQLPILIALYWVFSASLDAGKVGQTLIDNLYGFIKNPGTINPISLGILNLAKPSVVLAVLAGAAQYLQARTMTRQMPPKNAGPGAKDEGMAAMMNKQMLYFMPGLTVVIGISMPAGLTLYWFWSTILMAGQQWYMNKNKVVISSVVTGSTTSSNNVIEGEIIKK
ncbi:MAG: YidC/Oxa1 family membrane protein insertase [bacterium]|nr:YidC/Oxa1 family membrane protein insertase [bacterium]